MPKRKPKHRADYRVRMGTIKTYFDHALAAYEYSLVAPTGSVAEQWDGKKWKDLL